MNNALTTIDYSNAQTLATLRDTVARGATPAELSMFIEFAKATGLNPFKKEIWFIKDHTGRLQMMTGINGFWSLANSFSEFDGAEVGLIDREGNWVKSVPTDDFIGAWCRVYRKDRRIPMEGEALLSDYRKPFGLWKSAPRIMIKKVAESIALRKAFPQQLNGLYTSEEMPPEYSAVTVAPSREPVVDALVIDEPSPAPVVDAVVAPSRAVPPAATRKTKTAFKGELEKLATFYDLRTLEGATLAKATAYLKEACAKEVKPGVYRCPIKLNKLTSCIIPEEALEEGSQDDVPVEEAFPNV